MWRLRCADYDKAINEDIDLLVTLNVITPDEKVPLADLVKKYHTGRGTITAAQQNSLSASLRNRLHKGYKDEKLMYKDKPMSGVAAELYRNVGSCPYCGRPLPDTLDHFMHKSVWKSLSLCRLNLVPVCWKCNSQKGTKDSGLFAHPYYTDFPKGVFLMANCRIEDSGYLFTYDFDLAVVTDKALLGKLQTQWEELDLDERLRPGVTEFICSSVIKDIKDKAELKTLLPILLRIVENDHGKNHWKSAIVRCCIKEINGKDQDTFFAVLTDPANAAHDIPV